MKIVRWYRPLGLALLCLTASSCSGLIGLLDQTETQASRSCTSPDAVILPMTLGWNPGRADATDDWLDAPGRELARRYETRCPPRQIVVVASAALQERILASGAAATSVAEITEPAALAGPLRDLYRLEMAAYASRFSEIPPGRDDLLLPLATTHRTRTALRRIVRGLSGVTTSVWLAAPVVEPRSVVPSTDAEDAALFAHVQAPDAGTTWVAAATDTEWRVLLLDHRGDVVDQARILGTDRESILSFAPLVDPFEAAPFALPVTNGSRGGVDMLPVAANALTDPAFRATIIDHGVPLWMLILPRPEQAQAATTATWFRLVATAMLEDKGPWLTAASVDGPLDQAFAAGISPPDLLDWVYADSATTMVALPPPFSAGSTGVSVALREVTLPTALLPATTTNPVDAALELASGLDRDGNLLLLWSALSEGVPHLYHAIYDGSVTSGTRMDSRIAGQTSPRLLASGNETFALWSEQVAGTPRLRYARWDPEDAMFVDAAALVTRSTEQRYLTITPGDPGLAAWVENGDAGEVLMAATISSDGAVSEAVLASTACGTPVVLLPTIARNGEDVIVAWYETFCGFGMSRTVVSSDGGRSFGQASGFVASEYVELSDFSLFAHEDWFAGVRIRHVSGRDVLEYADADTELVLDEAPLIAQLRADETQDGVPLISWLRAGSSGFEVVISEPESDILATKVLVRSNTPVRSLQVGRQQDGRFFMTGVTSPSAGPRLIVRTDL